MRLIISYYFLLLSKKIIRKQHESWSKHFLYEYWYSISVFFTIYSNFFTFPYFFNKKCTKCVFVWEFHIYYCRLSYRGENPLMPEWIQWQIKYILNVLCVCLLVVLRHEWLEMKWKLLFRVKRLIYLLIATNFDI